MQYELNIMYIVISQGKKTIHIHRNIFVKKIHNRNSRHSLPPPFYNNNKNNSNTIVHNQYDVLWLYFSNLLFLLRLNYFYITSMLPVFRSKSAKLVLPLTKPGKIGPYMPYSSLSSWHTKDFERVVLEQLSWLQFHDFSNLYYRHSSRSCGFSRTNIEVTIMLNLLFIKNIDNLLFNLSSI